MDHKLLSCIESLHKRITVLESKGHGFYHYDDELEIKDSNPIPDIESLMSVACDGWLDVIKMRGASERKLRENIYVKVRSYLLENGFSILSYDSKTSLISRLDTQTLSHELLQKFGRHASANALKIIREIINAVIINHDENLDI